MANDYTPEQIKDVAEYLSLHPDKIPAEMKLKPAEAPPQDTTAPQNSNNIASVTRDANARIAELEEALANERKATVYAMSSGIQSALKRQEEEMREKIAQETEKTQVTNDLYSVMPRPLADQLLKDNLPIHALKSVIETMKRSGAARVGVSTGGMELRSTTDLRMRMEALGIPSMTVERKA